VGLGLGAGFGFLIIGYVLMGSGSSVGLATVPYSSKIWYKVVLSL